MSEQFFKTHKETQAWLDAVGVKRYSIRDDLTVDVDGDVDISNLGLKCIPVRFGAVKELFNCSHNQLIDLAGSPEVVEYSFWCGWNKLASLTGAPTKCQYFDCDNNQLTSLDGVPVSCKRVCCYENPDLYDISAAPDGCKIEYDHDAVAKNLAARQLAMLNAGCNAVDGGMGFRSKKPGRIL